MNKAYIRFPGFRRKTLTLSYDDGVRRDKRLIAIMKQHGFNLNGGAFASQYDGREIGRRQERRLLRCIFLRAWRWLLAVLSLVEFA